MKRIRLTKEQKDIAMLIIVTIGAIASIANLAIRCYAKYFAQ